MANGKIEPSQNQKTRLIPGHYQVKTRLEPDLS